ncbi:LpxL/LpxP family acyltransferase [Methylorubrum suomiense]|uniref:Lipid A biosynthesis acyltransferase n=1 Tax=Methylorubrum suomiense TaxID=144191 RepID=A0ABQ4V0T7_9HYPH|nr:MULTISPECIES: hypothetical protein [Methylobacteriaceae]GJE78206.1 hypothetical protein BGCPKDLD_4818 [Methylorubrum suomiense]
MIEVTRKQAFVAGLPLPARRRVLRASWRARRILPGTLQGSGRMGIDTVLERTLRVSRADSLRLDAEAVFSDNLVELEWLALLNRSHDDIRDDLRHVRIPDQGLIERVAASGRPVILAPLHMGCFALPFAGLIHAVFRGRRMLILRAREDHAIDTQVMQRINEAGVEMRFLNVRHKQDFIDAIRFARSGSVIVSFLDLPASYGVAADTTLFGRPARLAMGIDGLARLTEGTVLPLCVTSDVQGDTVHVGQPFEVADNSVETKRRVTEDVRRHIEASVLRAPQQWYMWPRLDEFLSDAPDPVHDRSAGESGAAA